MKHSSTRSRRRAGGVEPKKMPCASSLSRNSQSHEIVVYSRHITLAPQSSPWCQLIQSSWLKLSHVLFRFLTSSRAQSQAVESITAVQDLAGALALPWGSGWLSRHRDVQILSVPLLAMLLSYLVYLVVYIGLQRDTASQCLLLYLRTKVRSHFLSP